MKHALNTNTADALIISQSIMEKVVEKRMPQTTEDASELYQAKVEMHPIIANAMYARELKTLENERLTTLVQLARVLDDENMTKAINGLGYVLQTPNPKPNQDEQTS